MRANEERLMSHAIKQVSEPTSADIHTHTHTHISMHPQPPSQTQDPQDLLPQGTGEFVGAPHPRSVRVNPLARGCTTEDVLDLLQAEAMPKEWKGVSKATHTAVGASFCLWYSCNVLK